MPKLSDELAGPLRMMQVRRNLCCEFHSIATIRESFFAIFVLRGPGHNFCIM